jgi:biopolymer transport protein ExbB
MLHILVHGQWVLWVILFCSVISMGITFERWRTMRKADIDSEDLLNRLSDELDRGNVNGAISLCDESTGPVGDTLGSGLRKLQLLERIGKKPEEIEEGIVSAMEERGLHVINYLERNLSTLATMASLAPILGMLGTVLGMITAFGAIGENAGGAATPTGVGKGISEALYCTAGGLIVAAMSTVEYNYFASRVNRFALQVQQAAAKLVDRLLHSQSTGRPGGEGSEA